MKRNVYCSKIWAQSVQNFLRFWSANKLYIYSYFRIHLGLTEFKTNVGAILHANCLKRFDEKDRNWATDDESINPVLRPHYRSQQPYSRLVAHHDVVHLISIASSSPKFFTVLRIVPSLGRFNSQWCFRKNLYPVLTELIFL